ncbi:TonB-dependent receptor [Glycocaulis profundi]|nr:TonB-dependent receptor [Glycocaulis profundi]
MAFSRAFRCGASAAVIAISASMAAEASTLQESVSGRISDVNGAGLPGARVTVRELGLSAVTNRQGEYALPSMPAGEYTLVVDYLGFPRREQAVSVAADARTVADVTLTSATDGIETIVVTGSILDGAARALNQQRTAINTADILSSDAIGRFPDANIAEALQRVPGIGVQRDQGEGRTIQLRGAPPEFTSITVDGTSLASPDEGTRAIDLDTIPSDIVNAVEVSKTLLPSQEADSIAGAVNLVTRSPFDRPGFRANAQAGLSYNEIGGTNDYRASGVVSDTWGNGERIGALFSASYSQTNRQIDNVENSWSFVEQDGREISVSDDFTLKDYDTERTRTAFTGALEYRPDDATRFVLRGSWARFRDFEFRNRLTYELDGLQPGATDTTATWDSARLLRQLRNRSYENTIWTLAGTGEHDFGGYDLNYTISYNETLGDRPQGNELVLRTGANRTVSQDFSNPDEPAISPFATGEQLDLTGLGYRQVVDRTNRNLQTEWAARFSLGIEDTVFGRAARHQFGVSARWRDVEHDEERWRDRDGDFDPGPIEGLLGAERSQNYGYLLGNKFDEGLIGDYFRSIEPALRSSAYRLVEDSIVSDYGVDENIFAVYGMTTVQMGATEVMAGLRIEHTDFASSAFRFDEDTEAAIPVSNSRDYTDFFPNLTVRHQFNDNLVGRFALTRGISRPNYPDVVARVFVSEDGDEVERGNPNLKPTLSNNVDLGLEYYFEPLGLVAVNAFYKDLSNYEFTLVSPGTFEGQPVDFIQAENAPDGFIRGVEFTWQQSFGFLPGLLANTGIFANYTFVDAEMNIGRSVGGRDVFPLAGQSDRIWNIAVFYETDRFNARLAYTGRSDYIDGINAGDSRLDTYWEGRDQLDFTAAFEVAPRFELFLEAKNLTDTNGVRYDGVRSRVQEIERFGASVFTGVRASF